MPFFENTVGGALTGLSGSETSRVVEVPYTSYPVNPGYDTPNLISSELAISLGTGSRIVEVPYTSTPI